MIRDLFSNTDEQIRQTDIVMLLTPRIVRTHGLTREDLNPIHIGTQQNIGLSGPPPLIVAPPLDAAGAEASAELSTVPLGTTPMPTAAEPIDRARVLVTPPGTAFRVGGGPYTVPISVTGVSQLSTVTMSLTFDPSTLRVRSVQEGSFMRQGGLAVTFTQNVDSVAGRVDLTLVRSSDATGASGSGLVAAVLFEAVAAGPSELSLSGVGTTPIGEPVPLAFTPVAVSVR